MYYRRGGSLWNRFMGRQCSGIVDCEFSGLTVCIEQRSLFPSHHCTGCLNKTTAAVNYPPVSLQS